MALALHSLDMILVYGQWADLLKLALLLTHASVHIVRGPMMNSYLQRGSRECFALTSLAVLEKGS